MSAPASHRIARVLRLTLWLGLLVGTAAVFTRAVPPDTRAELGGTLHGQGLHLTSPWTSQGVHGPINGALIFGVGGDAAPLKVTLANGQFARLSLRLNLSLPEGTPPSIAALSEAIAPTLTASLAKLPLSATDRGPHLLKACQALATQGKVTVRCPALDVLALTLPSESEQRVSKAQRAVLAKAQAVAVAKLEAVRSKTAARAETHLSAMAQRASESARALEEMEARHLAHVSSRREGIRMEVEGMKIQADAQFSDMESEAKFAMAHARSAEVRAMSEGLKHPAARYANAIDAAERFQLGDLNLTADDPRFLYEFGSMDAWRAFFLGDGRKD